MGLEGSGAEDFSFQAEVRKILRILWKAINSSYGPGREPEKTHLDKGRLCDFGNHCPLQFTHPLRTQHERESK